MSATPNPYAPPTAHVDDVAPPVSSAEAIRLEHIKHETSVRSVGLLYYLGGGLILVSSILILAAHLTGPSEGLPSLPLGLACLAIGVLLFMVARSIRNLKPWARIAVIGLAALGLLGFPVWTALNAYILYLLLSKKGKRIFSDDYADIVAATPHVKYRTSTVTWVVFGVLILALIGLIAALILRN